MAKWWTLSFLSLCFLCSCLEDSESESSQEDYELLESDLEQVQGELKKAYQELDEYDAKFEDFEALEERAADADVLQQQLEQLQQEKEEAETKRLELQKEFEAYQKKYEAKVRSEAVGEELGVLALDGWELEGAVIRSVTETELKIEHQSGLATLNSETAPAAMKERFFLRSPEEIEQRELAFKEALTLASNKEEEVKTGRPPTDYQLRRLEREKQEAQLKALLSDEVTASVVLIQTAGGGGSGFFVQDGILTYLYTTAHLLDGAKGLTIKDQSGKEWRKFGSLEVAQGLNLVRMEVKELIENPLTLKKKGSDLVVGERIAVLSSGNPSGKITMTEGQIRGVSPDSYEASPSVLQGHNGGPMMVADGQVVALVSNVLATRSDIWPPARVSARVRQLGTRLDTSLKWEKTDLGAFIKAKDLIERYDQTTRLLYALAALVPSPDGLRLDTRAGGSQSIRDILSENADNEVVKRLMQVNQDLEGKKGRISERDLNKTFARIYGSAAATAKKQELRPDVFSSFHAQKAEASLQFREVAMKELADSLRSLRN